MYNKIKNFLRQETVLFILMIIFIFITALMPGYMDEYASFIDWKTIITLLALIITATGIKESGYLDKIAARMLLKIRDERTLAFFLVFLSAILSMFLTNDIALFITVPLTLSMQSILKKDLVKVVIFEALAVNAGSSLTAIGNPQNIYLWNKWGISFLEFSVKMAPLVLLMMFVLSIFIFFVFGKHRLKISEDTVKTPVKKWLGIVSAAIMALFLVTLQFRLELYLLPAVILVYLIFYRKVLAKVDWLLIITFVFMFINFSMISKIPAVTAMISRLDMSNNGNVFIISALVSQLMSNVPAAIFMSKFTSNWQALTFGVDIGGNGIIIGSLANIIAIRLMKPKDNKVWIEFHRYSIPFFLITGLIVWLFIK